MNIPSTSPLASSASSFDQHAISKQPEAPVNETQEAFTEFVGQTLFGSMLDSMRKTVGKPAYMHGGRTEEVFQQQMDQLIVEDLTEASASSIADPMYQLFQMSRSA
ncbi:rod-binding protein [Novipirellula caenicola]|uniref:Flagellar protein FlgJ N-terminal domain-containing protein n=1 Tax=Novipirellula caenicola TaxID=1536901 RepID=A0ABP9VW17_9BACT